MKSITQTTGNELRSSYVLYKVMNAKNGDILFIDACKMSTMLNLEGLLDNPTFDPDSEIIIGVMSVHDDEHGANNALKNELRVTYPSFNKTRSYCRSSAVECIETGERFRNQSDCAKAHDIPQGNLSNHLKQKPGYKSVKGRTYRRVI